MHFRGLNLHLAFRPVLLLMSLARCVSMKLHSFPSMEPELQKQVSDEFGIDVELGLVAAHKHVAMADFRDSPAQRHQFFI